MGRGWGKDQGYLLEQCVEETQWQTQAHGAKHVFLLVFISSDLELKTRLPRAL